MTLADQPSLPFARGSATSQAAAIAAKPSAADNRRRVLAAIAAAGQRGMTSDEVAAALDLRHQQASPRVCELAKAGLIVDSGATRATRSGPRYQAVVYRAAP